MVLFKNPIIIAVIGSLLLAVVSLGGLPIGIDESNWSITARMWLEEGRLPYQDTDTNKAPGIFVLNYASYELFGSDIFGPRLLAIFASFFSALVLYSLVRKKLGINAAVLASWIFVLIMPLDVVDGAFAQTETFMNMFRILAFYMIIVRPGVSAGRPLIATFVAGIFWAIAVSFKQIAIFDAIPLLVFLYFGYERNVSVVLRHITALSAGFVIGTLVSVFPLLLSGLTVQEYIDGAWLVLFQSDIISASPYGRISGFVKNYFEANLYPIIISLVTIAIFFKKFAKEYGSFIFGLTAWILSDFIAYNIQGQYFDHHHKVFLISGAIAFGLVVSVVINKLSAENMVGIPMVILMMFLFFVPFQPDYFHSIRNSIKGIFPDDNRLISSEVSKYAMPGDYIYIWGDGGGPIYYYSRTRPASKYYLKALLGRAGAIEELVSDLEKNQPVIVLVWNNDKVPEWLLEFLNRYTLSDEKYGTMIYRKSVD